MAVRKESWFIWGHYCNGFPGTDTACYWFYSALMVLESRPVWDRLQATGLNGPSGSPAHSKLVLDSPNAHISCSLGVPEGIQFSKSSNIKQKLADGAHCGHVWLLVHDSVTLRGTSGCVGGTRLTGLETALGGLHTFSWIGGLSASDLLEELLETCNHDLLLRRLCSAWVCWGS